MAAEDDVDFKDGNNTGVRARLRHCGQGIWNGQKKEFLGRTGSSWAKIGLFYLVFYSCLAGFFAIMLVGFFATIDDKKPTQQDMYSLIKANPGMGFRPMVNIESTLIKFNSNNSQSYEKQVNNIKDFLSSQGYFGKPATSASKERKERDDGERNVTEFDMNTINKSCNVDNDFGYKDGEPCVLLKINKVFNWKPEPLDNDTLYRLEDRIATLDVKKKLETRIDPDHIAVTCEGENDADIDNLGPVQYFPENGFPTKFYPYTNEKGYKSPLVYVKFPKVRRGAVIQVWCKLWVKNVKHHKNDKGGSVHFELLVD